MCLAILWLWYRHYYEPYFVLKRSIGLPGPTPKLFFGNARSIVDKGWAECMRQWTEKYGQTFLYFIGIQPIIFTREVDIIHSVFVNKAGHFIERFNMPFLFTDDSKRGKQVNSIARANRYEWKRMHRMLSPLFTSKKVMQMGPLIEVCCRRMMKRVDELLQDSSTINIYRLFGDFTMEAIMTVAFGRELDSQSPEGKQLSDCLDTLSGTGGKTSKWGLMGMSTVISHARWTILIFQALVKRSPIGQKWNFTKKISEMLVDERCANKTNRADALQGMIDLMDDKASKDDMAFSRLEVDANARLFLFAGHETTKIAMSMAAYCLANNHKVQEKAFNEIKKYFTQNPDASTYDAVEAIPYMEMIMLEAMRHYPPVKEVHRNCVETCAVNNNLVVPKDTMVFVPVRHINFNPDYWSNPDAFDPERFDQSAPIDNSKGFLTLGAGPRLCIGKRLALLDASMGLVSVLRKYKLTLAEDTDIEIDMSGMTSYPIHGVKIKFVPH